MKKETNHRQHISRIITLLIYISLLAWGTSCQRNVTEEWTKIWMFETPHYLSLSSQSFHFTDGSGGTQSLTITSTNTSWAVSELPDWITVDTQKGEESTTITLHCAANPSPKNARAAIFYVRSTNADWDFSLPVSVSQIRCLSYAIPQKESVTFDGKENSTTIALTTNVEDWTVSSTTEWLTVERGSDTQSVLLSVTPNPYGADRQGTVVVKSEDDEHYIRITQHPAGITSTLDQLSYIVEAGDQVVIITADAPWTAETSYAWIDAQPSVGSAGATEVIIRTTANNSMEERTGNIYFKMSDENKIQLPIRQDGITFALSDASLSFDCKGEKQTLTLTTIRPPRLGIAFRERRQGHNGTDYHSSD